MGEFAALATAVFFGLGALAFAAAGRRVGGLAVNLVRLPMAVVLVTLVHVVVVGRLFAADLAAEQAGWLAISAVVGLVLGDLCYFHCLAVLGARLGALLMSTAPAIGTVLAMPVLGESPTAMHAGGIATTQLGTALVISARRRSDGVAALDRGRFAFALLAGVLGALGQAVGALLSKVGMAATANAPAVDPLSATQFRLVVGCVGAWALIAATGGLQRVRVILADARAIKLTFAGAVCGPTIGIWLSLVALRHADVGVAMALMSTTPIVLLPLARLVGREPIGWVAVAGTIVAVAGVVALLPLHLW